MKKLVVLAFLIASVGRVWAQCWPVSAEAPVKYNIPDIGGMGEADLWM